VVRSGYTTGWPWSTITIATAWLVGPGAVARMTLTGRVSRSSSWSIGEPSLTGQPRAAHHSTTRLDTSIGLVWSWNRSWPVNSRSSAVMSPAGSPTRWSTQASVSMR